MSYPDPTARHTCTGKRLPAWRNELLATSTSSNGDYDFSPTSICLCIHVCALCIWQLHGSYFKKVQQLIHACKNAQNEHTQKSTSNAKAPTSLFSPADAMTP